MDTLFAVIILIGAVFYLKSALGRWNQRRYLGTNEYLEHSSPRTQQLSEQTAANEFEFDDDEQIAIDTELSQLAPQLNGKSIKQADMIRIENGVGASALYHLAKARFQDQDIEGAFATLHKSMVLNAAFEGQWLLLAEIYAETNQVADAKDALRNAEERFGQDPEVEMPKLPGSLGGPHFYQNTWESQIARVKKRIQEAE
jgi:hypothetical protein